MEETFGKATPFPRLPSSKPRPPGFSENGGNVRPVLKPPGVWFKNMAGSYLSYCSPTGTSRAVPTGVLQKVSWEMKSVL